MDPVISFDLHKFLGFQAYHAGVSWDVFNCGAAIKDAFKNMTETQTRLVTANLKHVRALGFPPHPKHTHTHARLAIVLLELCCFSRAGPYQGDGRGKGPLNVGKSMGGLPRLFVCGDSHDGPSQHSLPILVGVSCQS